MNTKVYLPLKNLPYLPGDDNRPNFYDPISKTNTFDKFDKEYFNATPEKSKVVNFKGFELAELKLTLVGPDRNQFRQLSNIKIQIASETEPRYYFITNIQDSVGEGSIVYEMILDYWTTYWNNLEWEGGYAKVLRQHQNRFRVDASNSKAPTLVGDFSLSSGIWNDDTAMTKHIPTINVWSGSTTKSIVNGNLAPNNYSSNIAFSISSNSNNVDEKYVTGTQFTYAIMTFLSGMADSGSNSGDKLTLNKAGYQPGYGTPQPLILVPLYVGDVSGAGSAPWINNGKDTTTNIGINNSYSDMVDYGNAIVVKIIQVDFPLISNDEWIGLTPIGNFSAGTGKNATICGINLDSIQSIKGESFYYLQQWDSGTNSYFNENLNLNTLGVSNDPDNPGDGIFPIKDPSAVKVDDGYSFNLEPKLYMSSHLKLTLQCGFAERELKFEKLMGKNDLKDYNINFQSFWAINSTNDTKIIRCLNGIYDDTNNINENCLLINASFGLPTTNNAEVNYFQQHKNSFNTSRWAIGAKQSLGNTLAGVGGAGSIASGGLSGALKGAEAGSMIPGVGNVVGGVLGGIAGTAKAAFGMGSKIAQNNLTAKIGNRQLDSQIKDLDNTPETVKGVSDRDMYMLNLMGYARKLSSSQVLTNGSFMDTFINGLWITKQEQQIVSFHYNCFGYITNIMKKLTKDELFTRYRFNYLQVNNFHTALNKDVVPLQVIEWFDAIFEKGVRLWTVDDGTSGRTVGFNDYQYENWEVSLLKETNE